MQADAHRLNVLSIQESAVVSGPERDLVLTGNGFSALWVSPGDCRHTHIWHGLVLFQVLFANLANADNADGNRFVFDRRLFSKIYWLNLRC